jgi:hypothetical protein
LWLQLDVIKFRQEIIDKEKENFPEILITSKTDTIETEIDNLIKNGKKYFVILLDIPWDYSQKKNCKLSGISANHYSSLSDGRLLRLKT